MKNSFRRISTSPCN